MEVWVFDEVVRCVVGSEGVGFFISDMGSSLAFVA